MHLSKEVHFYCFNPRTRVGCDHSISSRYLARSRFQSAHPRKVRLFSWGSPRPHRRFNPRTPWEVRCICGRTYTRGVRFNPRTHEGCDDPFRFFHDHIDVSIRAPAIGTMATHSKIRPFRVPSPPLDPQNRRVLGKPFPTHASLRPFSQRGNESILWSLWIHTRTFLWLISLSFVLRLQNFGRHLKTTFLWFISSPNQAMSSTSPDNQSPHQAFPLIYQQDFIYKKCNTSLKPFFTKK